MAGELLAVAVKAFYAAEDAGERGLDELEQAERQRSIAASLLVIAGADA